MCTSACTLGVRTSSDMEVFLGFSGGVVELGVGCCVTCGITLGVVGPAIGRVGSTIGWGMYETLTSASNSMFTKLAVSGNRNKQQTNKKVEMENPFKRQRKDKFLNWILNFWLEE